MKPGFYADFHEPLIKELRAEPQYHFADVRAQLDRVAKTVGENEHATANPETQDRSVVIREKETPPERG